MEARKSFCTASKFEGRTSLLVLWLDRSVAVGGHIRRPRHHNSKLNLVEPTATGHGRCANSCCLETRLSFVPVPALAHVSRTPAHGTKLGTAGSMEFGLLEEPGARSSGISSFQTLQFAKFLVQMQIKMQCFLSEEGGGPSSDKCEV